MSLSVEVQKAPAQPSFSCSSLLCFILALALVRGIIYAAVIPPWQAPDEPAQFERVKASLAAADWNSTPANPPAWYTELRDSLVTFQFTAYTLVRPKDTPGAPLEAYVDLYHQIYGGAYGSRFSYAVMGWPLLLAPSQEIVFQLYLIRLYTVVMGAAMIWLAYRITLTLFPGDAFLVWGAPLLILLNPQHSHILSTVNNGNLAELLATAALFFMVRAFYPGPTRLNVGLALAFALLAVWTKATAYFLFFSLATLGLFFLYRYRAHWRWLLLVFGGALLGAYFLAPGRLVELARLAWSGALNRQFYLNPVVLADIFASYWAMPGWAILRLNPMWYQILLFICGLTVVGLVILLAGMRRSTLARLSSPAGRSLLLLGVSVGAAIAIQLGWHILTGSLSYRQGRSLYPVIVPLSIFLMLGWRQLIPPAWRKPAFMLMTAALFLFDSMVLLAYIIPFFYSG